MPFTDRTHHTDIALTDPPPDRDPRRTAILFTRKGLWGLKLNRNRAAEIGLFRLMLLGAAGGFLLSPWPVLV